MFPEPIRFLGLEFHWYSIWIAIGILVCFGVLFFFGKKRGINPALLDFVFYAGVVSILAGFGSAALFQAFYNYLANPEAGFKLGGITFIGGLIGGVIIFLVAYFIWGKKYGKLSEICEIAPCCILIAHAFGRIGCYFGGCCYGKVTDSAWGVLFPGHTEAVYPTNLYEAIFLFLLFGVVAFLYWKKKSKYNLDIYLIAYGVFRFFIEYLRGDPRGSFIPGMSPSQFWSILMVVIGIVLIVMKTIYPKHQKAKVDAYLSSRKSKESTDDEEK